MTRLCTSVRSVPAHVTLEFAKEWAKIAQITAVSDITSLDCLGVPVFVSERPAAANRFAFGKGRVAIEAEVGAYMEGIESHFAEPGAGGVEMRWGTPRDLACFGRDPIFEFAPRLQHGAKPDQPLLLARARDVQSGGEAWVPAELVFNPSPDTGPALYGTSGNGLASGNSVPEASLHALLELIERDIWSIEFVRDHSTLVLPDGLPAEIADIARTAARNGLRLVIRAVPNDFGIPFFAAFLFDPANPCQRFFNGGWGCHLDREIALTRAVAEAAQSRAAFLHGGRMPPGWSDLRPEAEGIAAQIEAVSRDTPQVRFGDIAELDGGETLEAQWAAAVACLRRVVDRPIYRVIYTPDEGPLHVVRLIVPLLENFTAATMRVGPRLQAELEIGADAAASLSRCAR